MPGDPGQALPFFSDDELLQVLSEPTAETPAPAVSGEAKTLARLLGAQYAEVIAHYAVDALAGRSSRHAPKLKQIIRNLTRLATEMDDLELLALYDQLAEIVQEFSDSSDADARAMASRRLRDWVMRFADSVGDEAGQKLRKLVVFRKGVHPLISHLRDIRGIGDARLERLYAAGLLTTESLVDADPTELAQVVGIPPRLARQVVEACQRFAETQRVSHVKSLKTVVTEVTRLIKSIDPHDESHVRLVAAVRETITGLEEAVRTMEASWRREPEPT